MSAPSDRPQTLSRQASEVANSAIIYEVNLSVPKDKADDYVLWLRGFTKEVCATIDGFTGVQVFTQPKPVGLHWLSEEGAAKVLLIQAYFTVHYHIDSQQQLDAYLNDHQERVAEAEQRRFQFLVTSRRILRLQFSTIE
ncbi:hypothetical protein HK097_006175 [Rhizophlyctis rosea]|uniref:Uncharacterized protein n=1 Tax=Rhizophlyctis rosea TaxID=64517 RepID=A0AAD5SM07_9FUNG|nr:hypothetical protein HK097_006175 [Rhizophlyctis rosea]